MNKDIFKVPAKMSVNKFVLVKLKNYSLTIYSVEFSKMCILNKWINWVFIANI